MTTLLQDILAHNRAITEKEGEARRAAAVALEKTPHRRCAIFTCMDARLVEMVEPALGIQRGDAVVLRNAGNIIGTLEGTMIISLLVAVFMQNIEEIIVVGHEDCGFTHASSAVLLDKMRRRGIGEDHARPSGNLSGSAHRSGAKCPPRGAAAPHPSCFSSGHRGARPADAAGQRQRSAGG